jgi:hypothetical protein
MTNLSKARERKQQKLNYIELISDLSARGFYADLETVEIGSLGHFLQCSVNYIFHIIPQLPKRTIANKFI